MDIKTRVINACQQLILDYGYRGFTMDQLAQRAGVSKRTLYRHFPSRDAVIEATLDSFMHSMAGVADDYIRQEKDPAALIKAMFTDLTTKGHFALNPRSMDELRRYYPHFWNKIDAFRMERLRSIFAMLSSRGYIPSSNQVNPTIALQVVSSAIQNVINPDFLHNNGLSFQQATQELIRILLYGLLGSSNRNGMQLEEDKRTFNC